MKDGIENSWVPYPGFEPPPSAQQASVLPLDHSAVNVVIDDINILLLKFLHQIIVS